MRGGDITQADWGDIKKLCQNYSRVSHKKTRGYPLSSRKSNSGVSKMELSNFFRDFKQDIINNMDAQIDTLQAKKKHGEAEAMLVEFCPHCRQRKKDCRCKKVQLPKLYSLTIWSIFWPSSQCSCPKVRFKPNFAHTIQIQLYFHFTHHMVN